MLESSLPHWSQVHTIAFDFDGVFTNNKVYVSEEGFESVLCDRSDSLGLNFLRQFIDANTLNLEYFILSTESNPVVQVRANKLKIKAYSGITNKLSFLQDYLSLRFPESSLSYKGLIYLGNDLNDLTSINYSGFSVVPADSHPLVLQAADLVLKEHGGEGFVRSFLEKFLFPTNDDIQSWLLR